MAVKKEQEAKGGNGSIIVFVIGLILVLAVGVFAYFWPTLVQIKVEPVEQKPSQEVKKDVPDYEGWNTYTNDALGYSLKYPKEWSAAGNKYDARGALFGSGATSESGEGGVEVHELSGSVEDYMAWEEKNVSGIKFENKKTVALENGMSTTRAEYKDIVNGVCYFLKEGNLLYKMYSNSTSTENTALFDMLAKTFTPKPGSLRAEDSGQFTLSSGISLKVPEKWMILSTQNDPQFTNYYVSYEGKNFSMNVINTDEWLKGPNVDEGYVIGHDLRPVALNVLKKVYEHGQVTVEDKKLFADSAGEFLGYGVSYRADLSYIASEDDSFRGLTFFNLQGQSAGVSPAYYLALYNPNKNLILFGVYSLDDSYQEVESANKPFVDLESKTAEEARKLDNTAHEQFKKLVEKTFRKDLSFGATLDAIDEFFKSATVGAPAEAEY